MVMVSLCGCEAYGRRTAMKNGVLRCVIGYWFGLEKDWECFVLFMGVGLASHTGKWELSEC